MKKFLLLLIGAMTLTSCIHFDIDSSSRGISSSDSTISESSDEDSNTSMESSESSNVSSTSIETPPEIDVYSIIYHLNCGSGVDNGSYTPLSDTITLPIPTRDGYSFNGWFDNVNFTGSAVIEIVTGSNGDKEFWAKWSPDIYTITYNLNGGEGIEYDTYNIETAINLPTPAKTGYDFVGWYENSLFSGDIVTTIPIGSTGNKEYWAKYSLAEYLIVYNVNGGTSIDNSSYTMLSDTITLPNANKNGYDFLGWYDNADFNGSVVTEIPSGSVGNKTFYAKWNTISYSITYNLNGGTGVSNSNYTIETNTITLPTPNKTGYSFVGWYESSDFSGSIITTIPKGSTGNKEFYAKWNIVSYSITYNLNGGTGASNSNYTIETNTITLPIPNKTGYDFVGWYANSLFTDSAVTTIPQGSTGNKTFYAKWNTVSYSITYNLNGGTGVSNSSYTIETNNITLPTPSKTGYSFMGWYANAELTGSVITTIPKGSTGNKEFWAKWVEGLPYSVVTTPSITVDQVEKGAYYKAIPPYKGALNILVIPVHFADSTTCASAGKGRSGNCNAVKEDMEKLFIGTAEETGWESLASYYNKSSYGNLNITGKVSNWYTSSYTSSQFQNLSLTGQNASYNSQILLRNAVTWYKANNSDVNSFDTNNDNYFDMVYLVYDHAIDYDEDWWAYKYYDYGASTPTPSNKVGYQYMFASMNFMYEDPTYTIDAHTFIHETGHLLNLDDYYNTGYSGTSPAGGLDMQDMNIGDQNAYSKFLLDWIDPMVINNNGTVDLRPFESSGDAIIIPASTFNNSAYDEYLILEYITPTGLNYRDSHEQYGGNYPLFYTQAGVRVWHVDSRLATNYGSGSYTSTIGSNAYPAHSNTPSSSKNANIALLQLISKTNSNFYSLTSRYANSTDLFKNGDTFDATSNTYKNQFMINIGKFNKNTTAIGYTFTITYLGADKVTIHFTKL
jgi:M6 family metalloprotease-like protein/uncharacterized repeat protein (TIGR02543 family)